jgi:2'-5' RNA ligase
MIRSFIAIALPTSVKEGLEDLIKELKSFFPKLKWIKSSNIHLTLKFLGNIKEEQIPFIKNIMSEVAQRVSPFTLQGFALGVFPSLNHPRVIWTGLQGGLDSLKTLGVSLEEGLAQIGFAKENRPFSPHLTLGRIKTTINTKSLSQIIEKYATFRTTSFIAEKIVLFKSELHPQGTRYTVLEKISLKKE